MYAFKYDPVNHKCQIMNGETKKGVALVMVGEDMAKFLKELVFQANKQDIEALTHEVLIDTSSKKAGLSSLDT